MLDLRKLSIWPRSQWLFGQLRRKLYFDYMSPRHVPCRIRLRDMWRLLAWVLPERMQRKLSGNLLQLRFKQIQNHVGIRGVLDMQWLSVWPGSRRLWRQLSRQLYPSDVSVRRISCRVRLRDMRRLLAWNISSRVQRQLGGNLLKLRFRQVQVIVGIRAVFDLWRLLAWNIS